MDNVNTPDEPPHNVIVTSIRPPQAVQIWPYPAPQQAGAMDIPFPSQNYQFPVHQPQGQQIPFGHPPPVQRSQSRGNAPPTAEQRDAFNMGNMTHALPAGSVQQGPPTQPQGQLWLRPRFQTGASAAAVAYRLSQQMQHYQGAVPGMDFSSHLTYQQSATFCDPYGQQYTTFVHGPQGGPSVPYSANYPPPPYHVNVATGTVSPLWCPPYPPHSHPQHQHQHHQHQATPYYYVQPTNYAQYPIGPMGQLCHTTPEHFQRHTMPIRPPGTTRGLENEVMGHPGANCTSPVMRNTGNSTANISNTPPPPPLPTHQSPPSIPRGPPRKPRQSGNALWVGNLPPATDVAALKDFFSSQARNEIESVFLISKSNCAFVNYRTETACDEAMARFHNSKFRGTRLVCRPRPRKGSTPFPGAEDPATPTDMSFQSSGEGDIIALDGFVDAQNSSPDPITEAPTPTGPTGAKAPQGNARFRYFILKSLTVEDLEVSVKNGVWATQSHNETALNQAFEAAESVFLIFSANKSGEYYGYARMASKITNENSISISWTPPTHQSEADAELPKAIYTAPTETAPRGRIIDDSARGTIFWEALSDEEASSDVGKTEGESEEAADGKAVSKVWGKPFSVEWLSTSRVPFYRTRGLRNNLNSGREVKVARDGTELEESTGRRLVHMFHQRTAPAGIHPHHSSTPVVGASPPQEEDCWNFC